MSEKTRLVRWSEAVELYYEGTCPHCWRAGNAAHHIIGRENRLTRFILQNGIYVCSILHRLFERPRDESNEQILFYIGKERWENLQAIAFGRAEPWDFGYTVVE